MSIHIPTDVTSAACIALTTLWLDLPPAAAQPPAPPVAAELPALPPLPPAPPVPTFDFAFDWAFQSGKRAGPPQPNPPKFPGRAEAADDLYRQARNLIDQNRYDRAIAQLDRITAMPDGPRVDAALYWKAYAQAKLAQRAESLTTLADLQKRFSRSAWVDAARALEVEVKQASGQSVSPDALPDEDLKLLALRGLMQSDPDRALPMVERVLAGNSSVRVKENALFVLSQSRTPRAREIIAGAAKSSPNPDVQMTAVRYLGTLGGADTHQTLEEIYRSTRDAGVRQAVITALVRGQAADRLVEIVRTETDVELKRIVVRNLGAMVAARSGDQLKSLYRSNSPAVKSDVVNALYAQRNAAALVELARAEQDHGLKKDIVARLSNMRAKEATDYMLELLK